MASDGHVRPVIEDAIGVDDAGCEFVFGKRWSISEEKPADAYSRVTSPERFAVLGDVAAALVSHLTKRYEVDVAEERGDETLRVQLRPVDPVAAPLDFEIFDSAVQLRAGCISRFFYPVCQCDACDDSGPALAKQIENTVFAVVDGGLFESVDGRRSLRTYTKVEAASSSRSSSGKVASGDVARVRSVRPHLDAIGGQWRPWHRR